MARVQLLSVLLVLAFAALFLAGTPSARAANIARAIEMRSIAFTPTVIRVDPGDTVTLNVFNNDSAGGGVPHTFDLPAFNIHLGTVSVPMAFGENRSATFVASPAGVYYFYCSISGHASDAGGGRWTGMAGRIEVGPPPSDNAILIIAVGGIALVATLAIVVYVALRKKPKAE